jgi:hypothetical protein
MLRHSRGHQGIVTDERSSYRKRLASSLTESC